jgi:signal transduction histidine kinase
MQNETASRFGSFPFRFLAAVVAVVAISLAHYLTDPVHTTYHVVYQRLYYIPLLFGAGFYGLRGGLALAIITSVLYLPHIVLHWGHEPLYRANQMAELLMFLVVGTLAGLLIDRVRNEREKHRRTAEELAGAYEQLQATFERLRLLDRLSSLGALSVSMAHEIRNPLGAVSGAVEILESSTPEGDHRREFVILLKKEIDRLSATVTRQLDLARSTPHDLAPCDIGGIVRSVLSLTAKEMEKQGVTATCRIQPGTGMVEADEQRLRQAVLNLVLNAVQAMEHGGELSVQVGSGEGKVSVELADDGPGFTDEALLHGIDPFFTTREEGTGLGLSIAFQIADQHGGDLIIGNRKEGGACVRLVIPAEGIDG